MLLCCCTIHNPQKRVHGGGEVWVYNFLHDRFTAASTRCAKREGVERAKGAPLIFFRPRVEVKGLSKHAAVRVECQAVYYTRAALLPAVFENTCRSIGQG